MEKVYKLTAVDANGKTVTSYKPRNQVYFQVLAGSVTLPDYLTAASFRNGVADVKIVPHSDYGMAFRATDGEISGESKPAQSVVFTDVDDQSEVYKAVSFLKKYKVLNGYPDGSFKPDQVVTRVEAVKFILAAVNAELLSGKALPFKDTSSNEWYSDYVATAYERSIVNGYPDKTFKPSNTVNRAEFLKMLLVSMDLKVNPFVSRDVFNDVKKDSWYASYVKYAADKNLINVRGRYFKPEEGMTRSEVADLLYRTILLKASDAQEYSTDLKVSEGKIAQYFG